MISDEFLYHTGIITAGISLGIIILYTIISYIVSLKLKYKFKDEYGSRKQKKK